jgi:HEAT repeat protein
LDVFTTTNISVFNSVLKSLKSLGASKELILRKVHANLGSPDDDVRTSAAELVLKDDKADQEAQSALISVITNNLESQPRAIAVLGKARPVTDEAIQAVLTALDGANADSWITASYALTNMGVPSDVFLPHLEKKIMPDSAWKKSDDFKFLQIATLVLKFDPANRDAQLALIRMMGRTYYHADLGIIKTLLQAKPVIPEVLEVLQNLRKSKYDDVRKAATDAIKQIEARDKAK